MPIKAYLQSPPLRPTVNTHGLPPRRISALIIEEDLSDIDTPDSSWFLPANVYETITISQKEVPADYESEVPAAVPATIAPMHLDIPTAADTSRRPSISLARLQTHGVEDADIRLPNYDYAHSMKSASRRGSTSSDVFFHSPLRKARTYEDFSSSGSSSMSASGSSAASGYESPVFYPDSDCGCDDCERDDEETGISKMARSLPIQVPDVKGNAKRRRRGCFVQNDSKKKKVDEDEVMEDDEDEDGDEAIDGESIEDWVHFAYTPANNFETALISEVVRRRKSDERFATIKNGIGHEKELENAQFSESHRRAQWMRDMVRWYPYECGGGHVLPCIS